MLEKNITYNIYNASYSYLTNIDLMTMAKDELLLRWIIVKCETFHFFC